MRIWIAVLAASGVSYALKLLGYLVPAHMLQHRVTARITALLPAALLAALVVVQSFSSGDRLVSDARVIGVAIAAVALILRAPFIVVVVLAAASTAAVRALGWG